MRLVAEIECQVAASRHTIGEYREPFAVHLVWYRVCRHHFAPDRHYLEDRGAAAVARGGDSIAWAIHMAFLVS